MTSQDKDARYGPIVMYAKSKSEPDQAPYEVRSKGGVYSCNCKGWIFNRDKPKHCRHTDEARRFASSVQRVRDIVANGKQTKPQPQVQVLDPREQWADRLVQELVEIAFGYAKAKVIGTLTRARMTKHLLTALGGQPVAVKPVVQPQEEVCELLGGVRVITFDD